MLGIFCVCACEEQAERFCDNMFTSVCEEMAAKFASVVSPRAHCAKAGAQDRSVVFLGASTQEPCSQSPFSEYFLLCVLEGVLGCFSSSSGNARRIWRRARNFLSMFRMSQFILQEVDALLGHVDYDHSRRCMVGSLHLHLLSLLPFLDVVVATKGFRELLGDPSIFKRFCSLVAKQFTGRRCITPLEDYGQRETDSSSGCGCACFRARLGRKATQSYRH
jgi:hypothetical protein